MGGDLAVTTRLLATGIDRSTILSLLGPGRSALDSALGLAMLQAVLGSVADTRSYLRDGWLLETVLQQRWKSDRGRIEAVRLLLRAGANPVNCTSLERLEVLAEWQRDPALRAELVALLAECRKWTWTPLPMPMPQKTRCGCRSARVAFPGKPGTNRVAR
jgi:hypothetical protein